MDSGTQLEKLREVVKTIEDVDGAVPAALAAMPTDGLLNVASQVKMLIDAIPDTMHGGQFGCLWGYRAGC